MKDRTFRIKSITTIQDGQSRKHISKVKKSAGIAADAYGGEHVGVVTPKMTMFFYQIGISAFSMNFANGKFQAPTPTGNSSGPTFTTFAPTGKIIAHTGSDSLQEYEDGVWGVSETEASDLGGEIGVGTINDFAYSKNGMRIMAIDPGALNNSQHSTTVAKVFYDDNGWQPTDHYVLSARSAYGVTAMSDSGDAIILHSWDQSDDDSDDNYWEESMEIAFF